MTNSPTGLLVVFAYSAAVALSLPAAAGVLLLSRRFGIRQSSDLVGLAGFGIVVIGGVGFGVLVDPIAGLILAGVGFIAIVMLWAIPVFVGAYVVERLEGTAAEESIRYAVAGLPAALITSAILLAIPGSLARSDLTVLSEPSLGVVLLVVGVIVYFGPGIAGAGFHRVVTRRQ